MGKGLDDFQVGALAAGTLGGRVYTGSLKKWSQIDLQDRTSLSEVGVEFTQPEMVGNI